MEFLTILQIVFKLFFAIICNLWYLNIMQLNGVWKNISLNIMMHLSKDTGPSLLPFIKGTLNLK